MKEKVNNLLRQITEALEDSKQAVGVYNNHFDDRYTDIYVSEDDEEFRILRVGRIPKDSEGEITYTNWYAVFNVTELTPESTLDFTLKAKKVYLQEQGCGREDIGVKLWE